jgi:hypothetical protein
MYAYIIATKNFSKKRIQFSATEPKEDGAIAVPTTRLPTEEEEWVGVSCFSISLSALVSARLGHQYRRRITRDGQLLLVF